VSRPGGRALAPLAALLGCFSVAAQSLLAREALVVCTGSELYLGAALACWLLAGAAGALGAARWLRCHPAGPGLLAAVVGAASLALPLGVLAARFAPDWLGLAAGAVPGSRAALGAILAVLAGTAAACGAWFPAAAALGSGAGGPGRSYAWEAVGGLAGGVALALALRGALDAFTVAALGAAATQLLAAVVLATQAGRAARTAASALALAALATALAGTLGDLAERSQAARWPGYELVAARDGVRGNLALLRRDGLTTLAANGSPGASFPDPEAVEAATHLPLLGASRVRRVLLLNGAVGGALAETLKHPVERVDCLEDDPAVLPLARPHLDPAAAAALADPRVRVLTADPRAWLAGHPREYDAVLLGTVAPSSAAANRLATRESFALVRRALDADGVAAVALDASPNYPGPELLLRNASVAVAFAAAFPRVVVLRDAPLTLLGGDAASLSADPDRLAARFVERRLVTATLGPEVVRALVDPARNAAARRAWEGAGAEINRDGAPAAYFHHARYREAVADPVAAAWLAAPAGRGRWWVFALALAPAAAAMWPRRAPHAGRPLALGAAAAAAGATTMALQFLALFAWQSARGLLYGGLGVLSGLFMGGSALGAWLALRRLAAGAAPTRLAVASGVVLATLPAVAGAAIFGVLAAGAAGLPLLADLCAAAAAVSGGVAAGFGFAPLPAADPAGPASAGRYYALELAGSAAGALLASLWLLPLTGLAGALAFFAILEAGTLALLVRHLRPAAD
jgi:spermidine synthase